MTYEAGLADYALVDSKTALVVGVIVWDGVQEYDPGDGVEMVPLPYTDEEDEKGETVRRYIGGIDWTYRDGVFVDERPVEDME